MLFYLAALLTALWGIGHLFPTRSVVVGFGDISRDNRHIITMEWIGEGITLIFIGLTVAVVTMVNSTNAVSEVVYWICFAELNLMSAVSLFTGFKVDFIAFKLCPLIFTGSSLLILAGILF